MFKYLISILFVLSIIPGKAQQTKPVSGLDTLSLQDLMNIKLTVASAKELTPRESPGIVSYITAEDIRKVGARDLMDVLKFVPGFEFGTDVEGVVGLGIRGNWAHEGKVVLLIDGIEMNETLYSTLQFGNHYPIENVERIEIIRGPGSAMYGGFAAYAVINIISRKTRNDSETSASANISSGEQGISRTGLTAGHGIKKSKVGAGMNVSYNKSERSQKTYTDVYGTSYSMHNNSDLDNLYLNGYLNIGKTNFQLITDQYQTNSRDEYIEVLNEKYSVNFNSYHASLSQEIKAGNVWKIIPKLTYSLQNPWQNPNGITSEESEPFNVRTTRVTGQINATGDVATNLNILTGFQYFHDKSTDKIEGNQFTRSGSPEFTYDNYAIYVQGLYNIHNWNLVAGLRGNYNSQFDPTLTPRVGVTYVKENWHFKALYNKSFRSPSTQNLNLATVIYPEQTSVTELEAGFSLGKKIYFTANIYHITTTDPIIYFFDTLSNSDAYTNLNQTGSMGAELSLIYKNKRSQLETNFSVYGHGSNKPLSIYQAADNDENLGLAPVKMNLRYRYNFTRNFNCSFTTIYQSSKYAITSVDPESEKQTYTKLPSMLLANIYIEYNFATVKGLGIAVGVSNVLDEAEWFVQPYNCNHAPLPGMGREFSLKLFYRNF